MEPVTAEEQLTDGQTMRKFVQQNTDLFELMKVIQYFSRCAETNRKGEYVRGQSRQLTVDVSILGFAKRVWMDSKLVSNSI